MLTICRVWFIIRIDCVSFDTVFGGGVIKATLKNSFLFASLDEEKIELVLGMISGETRSFSKGDVIYSPDSYERKIGFVISGECEVCRVKHDGGRVKLNTLLKGDSFGITAVFSEDDFPTVVFARRASEVVFITKDELMLLINKIPEIALNIICFQNKKLAFLNKKIETFSASSVEERLAGYLLDEYKKRRTRELPLNRAKTADVLGVGRASLYRALDSLANSGTITLDSKLIFINDPKGLERIVK